MLNDEYDLLSASHLSPISESTRHLGITWVGLIQRQTLQRLDATLLCCRWPPTLWCCSDCMRTSLLR
jgi:hypothetical protein